jgi:3-dehydroquinate synthase
MGHVWESQLGWSHGESVLQGIFFSLHWSHHLGILRPEDYREILFLMEGQLELRDRGGRPKEQKKFRLRETVLMKGLRADKKRSASNKIRFLFVRAPGEVFAQVVTMEQLVHEAKRQGWLE